MAWGYDFSFWGGSTKGYGSRGGGIGVRQFAAAFYPIISNCTIIGNQALNGLNPASVDADRSDGGGISFTYAGICGVIDSCLIQSNSAWYGGGYSVIGDTPLIKNCVIRDNTAGSVGGGIYSRQYGEVRNCLIYNNYAGGGSGIHIVNGTSCRIESCTIVGNRPNINGAGVAVAYPDLGTVMRMQNSIVMSNGTAANANLYYTYASPPGDITNHIIVSNSVPSHNVNIFKNTHVISRE